MGMQCWIQPLILAAIWVSSAIISKAKLVCQMLIKYTNVSCAISSLNYSHVCMQYEKMCGTRSFSLFAHEIQSGYVLKFLLLLKEWDAHQDVV